MQMRKVAAAGRQEKAAVAVVAVAWRCGGSGGGGIGDGIQKLISLQGNEQSSSFLFK